MTHRIFYGIDFKLTDSDKKMFSREGYECKDLLQGRAGAYSARTAHPFRRNGAPFRFKLSKAQQVD